MQASSSSSSSSSPPAQPTAPTTRPTTSCLNNNPVKRRSGGRGSSILLGTTTVQHDVPSDRSSTDFSELLSTTSFRRGFDDGKKQKHVPLPALSATMTSRTRRSSAEYGNEDDDSRFFHANAGGDNDNIFKLPFDEVGLAGREKEMEIMDGVLREVALYCQKGHGSDNETMSSIADRTAREQILDIPEEQQGDQPRSRGLVLVSGKAGTGKSSIVSEVLDAFSRNSSDGMNRNPAAVVATGKFKQQLGNGTNSSQPYSAISDALSGLVRKTVERNNLTKDGSKKLLAFLHKYNEVDALKQIVPNLSSLWNVASDIDNDNKKDMEIPQHTDGKPIPVPSLSEAEGLIRDHRFHHMGDSISVSSHSASTFELAEKNKEFDADRKKNIFLLSIRLFVRMLCICAGKSPVVLVIEDLQWADKESLDMLTLLSTDQESTGLVIVLTFRDSDSTHENKALLSRLELIEKSGVFPITKLTVCGLSEKDVAFYLGKLLSTESSGVSDLAAVIHKKTHGNPFFVRQFLESLYDHEFLHLNPTTFKWEFDVERIRIDTAIADDIAGVMTNNITNKLPEEAREILFVSSCIGSSFDQAIVTLIVHGLQRKETENADIMSKEDTEDLVESALHICTIEGLLERATGRSGTSVTSITYAFTHDYIQLAAFCLLEESDRRKLQWEMGLVVFESIQHNQNELNDEIFAAADLLAGGYEPTMQLTESKALALIELNLSAGKMALKSSAYSSALGYFHSAICYDRNFHDSSRKLLRETDVNIWLQLYENAASAALSYGDHAKVNNYADEIINEKSLKFDEKLNSYFTVIKSLGAQNKLHEALQLSTYLLEKLGVQIGTSTLSVIKNLMKTINLLGKYTTTELAELPLMEDRNMIYSMRIMDNAISYAYATNQNIVALLTMKMIRRSVKYGVCEFSPVAFSSFACLTLGILGKLKKAHAYAEVGFEILKRLGLKEMEARTNFLMYCFVLHWQDPLSESFRPYLRGYQVGLECGDLENAFFNITYHCDTAIHTGRKLSLVVTDFEAYTKQMEDFRLDYNQSLSVIPWQLALNLMGRGTCNDPCILTGAAMDQNRMITVGKSIQVVKQILNASRLCLAVYFCNYDTAWQMVLQTRDLAKTNLGQSVVWRSALYEGLTAFSLARSKKGSCRVWKMRAKKAISKVKTWASKGNVNCIHHLLLLNAELITFRRHPDKMVIRSAYNRAITSAARIGFINDQALANERAGTYFALVGDDYWSSHYLKSAYDLYLEWEAFGKTRQLRNLYPSVFVELSSQPMDGRK